MTDVRLAHDDHRVASIEHRLVFERLLADLSARIANVDAAALHREIEGALRTLLDHLGFDRSSFVEIIEDGTSMNVVCSVAVANVDPVPLGLYKGLRWYIAESLKGRVLAFQRLPDDLPADAVEEREYVARSGIKSTIGIPLAIGGEIVAWIGFAAFTSQRVWPDALIARLTLIGEVFAHAMLRQRSQARLEAALHEVRSLKERLEAENQYLRVAKSPGPRTFATRSPKFQRVNDDLRRVAATNATVLLQGETGTGKEVLAEAVHQLSARRDRSMVRVNCAALPGALVEAELFGREKGAYTGAIARQMGRFELAEGSTLFLDEVGELPLELQPKLLRVLQSGEFERVGGNKTLKTDVRIVAATNRILEAAVADGTFRRDLYYRLNVFPIEVPPLRERGEDIAMLAWTFVGEFSAAMGKRIDRIADDSMSAMEAYSWPGNVRELRNVIERAMILSNGPVLEVLLAKTAVLTVVAPTTLVDAERAHILAALTQAGGRIRGAGGAAELLDVKPTTLESRMQRLGIRRPN